VRAIDDVLSHETEPSGKSTEHAVGGEFHYLRVRIHENF
jgi:hypothetical protein